METFTKLFGSLLLFVYHCFDRIVIHGYLSGLSRPGQVVHFFHDVVGEPVIDKAVLSRRTNEYQGWVEAYARKQGIPIEWAEPKVRKEEYVRPAQLRMKRAKRHGVYFILKSMEQGQTFRSAVPKFPTEDPNYRILARQRSRFTHYYFYIEDEVLGPMSMRVASFFPFQATYYLNGHNFIERELNRERVAFRKNDNAFLAVSDVAALQRAADRFTPGAIQKRLDYWTLRLGPNFSKRERAAMNLSRFYAINQVEYCRNFIFRLNFPIHKIFERSCEIGLWRMTANKISEIFGSRITKKLKGKLNTTLEQIEHGHHIFRAYWKNAFIKQYEKFSTFLRNEVCSNNLADFGLKKGLSHLEAARKKQEVPRGHRPLRGFSSPVPQRSRRLPASSAFGPAHHCGNGEVPRHQNPRHPHDPPDGDSSARRHYRGRLASQRHPRRRAHSLRYHCRSLRTESAPLRSPENESARAAGTRRQTLCLPALRQRRQGRPHVCAFPQTALRPTRKQPLSPPARSCFTPEKQTRNRISQSRRFHPQHHPAVGGRLKC